MIVGSELESLQGWAHAWLGVLLDAAFKGAGVLLIAAPAARMLRRASASFRQLIWVSALGAVLVLPVLSAALPAWQVLPGWAKLGSYLPQDPQRTELVADTPADGAEFSDAPAGIEPLDQQPPSEHGLRMQGTPAPAARSARAGAREEPPPAPAEAPRDASAWMVVLPAALGVWALGTLLCLAPPVLGRLGLLRLARRCRALSGGPWAMLMRRATDALGLRRPVRLLQSDKEPMPMVWGVFRAKLLLPREADRWSAQRRWAVLLHELAHAKRHDCLAKLVAHLACAAYWFNPLCWVAFRRMQTEAEAACDDLVLAAGHRPSEYAQHLLEIASGLRSGMLAAYSSIAMARKSKLEGRLLAILDGGRNRRALTRWAVLAAALLITAVVLPLAVLRATDATDESGETADQAGSQSVEDVNIRQKVLERIYVLKMIPFTSRTEIWCAALRDLVEIGGPAVPHLVAELERTEDESTLRAPAFALRAIGDPRAVPALIDGIPKAALITSDFGLSVRDPELHAFMMDHRLPGENKEEYPDFGYPRSIRQLSAALQKITDHSVGGKYTGAPPQRRAGRAREVARHAQAGCGTMVAVVGGALAPVRHAGAARFTLQRGDGSGGRGRRDPKARADLPRRRGRPIAPRGGGVPAPARNVGRQGLPRSRYG